MQAETSGRGRLVAEGLLSLKNLRPSPPAPGRRSEKKRVGVRAFCAKDAGAAAGSATAGASSKSAKKPLSRLGSESTSGGLDVEDVGGT